MLDEKSTEKKKRLSISLTEKQINFIKKQAKANRISLSAYIFRLALEEFRRFEIDTQKEEESRAIFSSLRELKYKTDDSLRLLKAVLKDNFYRD